MIDYFIEKTYCFRAFRWYWILATLLGRPPEVSVFVAGVDVHNIWAA